jgi:HAD superfamily hydrolase (TIGR01490 family)
LPAARITGVDRRLEIFGARSGCGSRAQICSGGRVKRQSHELKDVGHAATRGTVGAAFFDIDGTLLAKPSLELRFFWELQRRGKIPARNYLAWLAKTIRLGLHDPRQLRAVAQTNKSYLRGVRAEIPFASGADHGSTGSDGWLPEFFPPAIQRVWWHALRGDAIVLVSGALAPLAEIVQLALERELLWRGVECNISVIATQLEISAGFWTGSVAGAAIFGEEKAAAIKESARAQNISVARCSAYGDSSLDRWMLAAVGHAFAVNPTRRLWRIARLRGWPILSWTHCAVRSASEQRSADEQQGLTKSLKLKREAAR